MRLAFYITNHGYGHAARCVAIIGRLLQRDPGAEVLVKSDRERYDFVRRNLGDRVRCFDGCAEAGLLLRRGTLEPDVAATRRAIEGDLRSWPQYIDREVRFLARERPDAVVTDVVCRAVPAARWCGIPAVLIGNFTWASMYRSFFGPEVWGPYHEFYRMADLAIWYELHDRWLDGSVGNEAHVSMVSREVDEAEVSRIRESHRRPIVYVSLGASAGLVRSVDVSGLPFDFVSTRGVRLVGPNAWRLPDDVTNTQDYVAASEYVIAKGGWSTVAEAMLRQRRCCLLGRGDNREDRSTIGRLEKRGHCIAIGERELANVGGLIGRMSRMDPSPYGYRDSTDEVCELIEGVVG